MRYNNNVWAIAYHYADIDSKVYEGFFGIYYFNIFIASECEGFRIATFQTRKIAREYLKEVRVNGYTGKRNRARVVKLQIYYKVIK